MLEDLNACEDSLKKQNDTPSGTLKLSVPVSYGRLYIRPMLREFCQRYPNINIDIHFDDAHVDIIEQGIDVAIRSGSVQDSQLIARQLSPVDFIVCGSKAYLEQKGVPASSKDFDQHSWIRFRYKQTGKLLPIVMPEDDIEHDPGRQFIVNNGESMAELCAQGLGLTQVPHFIARNWLNSGELIPLFKSMRQTKLGVYLLYAKREYLPLRVKLFNDYISETLEAQGETPHETWAETVFDAAALPGGSPSQ